MKKAERDAIMRQGIVLPETPRQRREQAGLEEDARIAAFDEINELIDRHNRWYPVESRLPMDPRRGDHALVDGRDYRLAPLDAEWVLERYPPILGCASST